MPSFSNFADFEKYLNQKINVAVKEACVRLLDELDSIIMEKYYEAYNPTGDVTRTKSYFRSFQFYSAATAKMMNQLTGCVFMDEDAMDYGEFWDGERQLAYAAEGYHGRKEIQTQWKYWDVFLEYVEKNSFKILKEEMKKQGIPLK